MPLSGLPVLSGTKSRMVNMTQRETILAAESALRVGPVALASLLNTPYTTLRDWKAENTLMPGVAYEELAALC